MKNKQVAIVLNESKKLKLNKFKVNRFGLRSKVLKATIDKVF